MIPAVIKKIHQAKMENKESVDIWGSGEARREFMCAADLADFVFFAIEKIHSLPQNTNVGIGTDYSINEYYDIIAEIIGYKGRFDHDLSKPVGMKQKLVDDSKIEELGWKHKTSLKEGIRQAYEYYKSIE